MTKFYHTTEFKVFLSVFIVYAFYLQMYGGSCMANSQSALTAAIVNEQRLEIDTYEKVSCDIAFYNEHYYSGQPPGISFLSVPLYAVTKPFFYLVPQNLVDSLYAKLERYGDTLPVDYWGKKKILSNYFTGLSKRQILEYIFISGFILPIFTTAIISALGVALFYHFLRRFTKNKKVIFFTTVLYAFGTIHFHLSTLYFERPIAITLTFAAFLILFKLKNNEFKNKKIALALSGLLAGISGAFDYFHVFVLPFLYAYALFALGKYKSQKFWFLEIRKKQFVESFIFVICATIPVLLLGLYHYAIFDDPFAVSYTHRIVQTSNHQVSDLLRMQLPSSTTIFFIIEFFLNSPIVLISLFAIFSALQKKDKYYPEILFIAIFVAFTIFHAAALALVYQSSVASQFNRHMTPVFPYSMLLIPYFLRKNKKSRWRLLLIVGILSLFMNWINTMYEDVENISLRDKSIDFIPYFFSHGPSSPFASAFAKIFGFNSLLLNILNLLALAAVMIYIWKNGRKR